MTDTTNIIKRVFISIILSLVTTIVGIFLNMIANNLFSNGINFANTLTINSTKKLNSYEKTIATNIVNADNISESLEDVGGLQHIKEDIIANLLIPLQHPKIFFSNENASFKPLKGLLFAGPPGTGKTMLARAIAKEANVPFIALTLSHLEDKYFGESNKLLSATFSLAKKIQPCIIFFDEIDGMLRKRSDTDQSCVYGFKTELLNQIDGLTSKKDDSIVIIGSTNHIESLDCAIRRRLRKVYRLDLPNSDERLQIIKLQKQDKPLTNEILTWLTEVSEGCSGSDIADLFKAASSIQFQELCKDSEFKQKLQLATCIQDVIPSTPLTKLHFKEAFKNLELTEKKSSVKNQQTENTKDDNEEEEAPPTTL